MSHRILTPIDRLTHREQCIARFDASVEVDDLIVQTMDHQDIHTTVGGAALGSQVSMQREVGRQRENAGQALRMSQPGMQRDRTALENPASTMRDAGMPRSDCSAINCSTSRADARMPLSSSRCPSNDTMSYQARIAMPLLIVTGRTGACGKTKRIAGLAGSARAGMTGSKSLPSAPSPCSQITADVGEDPVLTMMGGSFRFEADMAMVSGRIAEESTL